MLRQTGAVYNIRITYVASRDYSMIDTHFDEKKIPTKKKTIYAKKVGQLLSLKLPFIMCILYTYVLHLLT